MCRGSHETVCHHVPKQVLLLKGSQQLPLEPSRWMVDSQRAIPLWLHFPQAFTSVPSSHYRLIQLEETI